MQLGVKLHAYLTRVVQQAQAQGCAPSGADQRRRLQEALQELDRLGAEGAQLVDQQQLADIDRRLKACRNPLLDTASQQGRAAAAAKAKRQADKAARKAGKLVQDRAAREADVGILPDQQEAEPGAKRLRAS